jgi:hypothetical protein
MFLHIGGDYVVPVEEIIVIIDASLENTSPSTREFIRVAKADKVIVDYSDGDPKSYVLTDDHLILSPISSGTLQKRGELLKELERYTIY